MLEIILILIHLLLCLCIIINDTAILWYVTCWELFEHSIQLLLIGCGISVEIASLLVSLIMDILVAILIGNISESLKAGTLLCINVHVVNFWLLNKIKVLFLRNFLLVHFHFFLIFLDTVVNAMNKDISVNYFLLSESMGRLFVTKASSSRGGGNSTRCLFSDHNFLFFNSGCLNIVTNRKSGTIYIHFNFLLTDICCICLSLDWFLCLRSRDIGFRGVMDKLASHSIWAISVCTELFTKLGFVKNGYVGFDHHMVFGVGEWALLNRTKLVSI